MGSGGNELQFIPILLPQCAQPRVTDLLGLTPATAQRRRSAAALRKAGHAHRDSVRSIPRFGAEGSARAGFDAAQHRECFEQPDIPPVRPITTNVKSTFTSLATTAGLTGSYSLRATPSLCNYHPERRNLKTARIVGLGKIRSWMTMIWQTFRAHCTTGERYPE
jgi:hypothetical protein